MAVLTAGLPNITGTVGDYHTNIRNQNGSFTIIENHSTLTRGASSSGTEIYDNISFDASRSSTIYGNSDTVQPPAIVLIPQVKYYA